MADRRNNVSADEYPPLSRLFIISSKSLGEKDFRDAFEKFGRIEELWVVRDRKTGENKGVTYIKYSKTSEAARAMDEMNGKNIGNVSRSIKVMIAASKQQGSKREPNEEEKTLRLFVKVPTSMTETELYDKFRQFGNVDYANIVKDHETNLSKGFGFVKYHKFYDAANAFENCDRSFRAVFAEPKKTSQDRGSKFNNFNENYNYDNENFNRNKRSFSPARSSFEPTFREDSFTRIKVICPPMMTEEMLWRLFDIVPGMEFCQLRPNFNNSRNVGYVMYSSPKWASHAMEKLDNFEIRPGFNLIVQPDNDFANYPPVPSRTHSLEQSPIKEKGSEILHLAETIAKAAELLKSAGIPSDFLQLKLGDYTSPEKLCNVPLPDPKPLLGIDENPVARCFIVCSPHVPPMSALRDVFSRFGNLIDVYMLANKNCGFAKYGSVESAKDAINILNGCEVCGCRIKVIKAEEPPDHDRKRMRYEK